MPVSRSPIPRLPIALICSLLLHVGVLVLPSWWSRPEVVSRPPLQARLATPANLEVVQRPADSLLKDTLAKDEEDRSKPLPAKANPGARGAGKAPKSGPEAARRKLARHVFYPEEAIRRGWEGDVRVLVVLDETGRVLSADVAASSGHAVLDEAARSAALAMGSLPDAGVRQFILTVPFRLR